ncbi:unnamed protein product, partial [Polarella glacialis]
MELFILSKHYSTDCNPDSDHVTHFTRRSLPWCQRSFSRGVPPYCFLGPSARRRVSFAKMSAAEFWAAMACCHSFGPDAMPVAQSAALAVVKSFAHPINTHLMRDNDEMAPSSERPMYRNEFVQKTPKEHQEEFNGASKLPAVHDTADLVRSNAGDPHQYYGLGDWRYVHYDTIREPTFPRKPDLSKGELASGATVTRTDVWHDPNEPAITSIAKFSPENFRPVGWAENAPMPTSTCPEGTLDFRYNRLPIGHADRRPWVYFMTAASGVVAASLIRAIAGKLILTLWPAKDVFAAGVVEVDLRPIREGQNFV